MLNAVPEQASEGAVIVPAVGAPLHPAGGAESENVPGQGLFGVGQVSNMM